MNPYDDGIGMDEFVDWLIDAGYPIQRIADYGDWLQRFETALRALPEKQRQPRCCRCCTTTSGPTTPINGSMAPTDRFRAAVQDAKIGPDKDIPHISRADHRQVHHRPAAARPALRSQTQSRSPACVRAGDRPSA